MKAVTLTVLGLTALALIAFLLGGARDEQPGDSSVSPQAGAPQTARSTRDLEPVDENAAPVSEAEALNLSTEERTPVDPTSTLNEVDVFRALHVRFEDVVSAKDLGLFPVFVQEMSLAPEILNLALERHPHGHLPESFRVKGSGEFDVEPVGEPRLVELSQDGTLPVKRGLYRVWASNTQATAFVEGADSVHDRPDDSDDLVVVGRAERLVFHGLRLTHLTVELVFETGEPFVKFEPEVSDWYPLGESPGSGGYAELTELGPGRFEAWIGQGALKVWGYNDEFRLLHHDTLPYGTRTHHVKLVPDRIAYDGSVTVRIGGRTPAVGAHFLFSLTSGIGARSNDDWRPVGTGGMMFDGLRTWSYAGHLREVFPSGRHATQQVGKVKPKQGEHTDVTFTVPPRTKSIVLGYLRGVNSCQVQAFPIKTETDDLSTTRVEPIVGKVSQGEFELTLPRAGLYQLGFELSGARWPFKCGTFRIAEGQVLERSFDLPRGSLRVEFPELASFHLWDWHQGGGEGYRVLLQREGDERPFYSNRLMRSDERIVGLPDGTYELSFEFDSNAQFTAPGARKFVIADGAAVTEVVQLASKQ